MVLSDDVRESFGRMIVEQRSLPTVESRIRYAETLIQIVETGVLASDNKTGFNIERYVAGRLFGDMIKAMQTRGRPEYRDSTITYLSNSIASKLLPIIITQGFAIINNSSFSTPSVGTNGGNK